MTHLLFKLAPTAAAVLALVLLLHAAPRSAPELEVPAEAQTSARMTRERLHDLRIAAARFSVDTHNRCPATLVDYLVDPGVDGWNGPYVDVAAKPWTPADDGAPAGVREDGVTLLDGWGLPFISRVAGTGDDAVLIVRSLGNVRLETEIERAKLERQRRRDLWMTTVAIGVLVVLGAILSVGAIRFQRRIIAARRIRAERAASRQP